MFSADTGVSQNDLEIRRTRREKKPKFIEDLGYVEKKEKKQKLIKKQPQKDLDNSKYKHCFRIFTIFKKCENYHKFPLFTKIEKSLKNLEIENVSDLACKIRKVFNNYFTLNISDPLLYKLTFDYSVFFENIYKEVDVKIFNKESKNILDLKKKMNKLKRDMKQKSDTSLGRFKINLNSNLISSLKEKRMSKKFKSNLVSNIKSLTNDQIKGILEIIYDNLDISEDKTMEIDINKLSGDKLREIDKYIKRCHKGSNLNLSRHMKSTSSINLSKFSDYSPKNNLKPTLSRSEIKVSEFFTPEINKINNNNISSGINLNININNNFVVNNYKQTDDSDLSLSDSLSSDSDSGKYIFNI